MEEDFILYEGNVMFGKNYVIKLVDLIVEFLNLWLFVFIYKMLEYDLVLEGNNVVLMFKIIVELWFKFERGISDIIIEFIKLLKLDWNEIGFEEIVIVVYKIFKCIDDENIGKGMFV